MKVKVFSQHFRDVFAHAPHSLYTDYCKACTRVIREQDIGIKLRVYFHGISLDINRFFLKLRQSGYMLLFGLKENNYQLKLK